MMALLLQTSLTILVADRPVDSGASPLPLTEPHLAVHPEEANRFLVGAIVSSPERSGPWHCAAFTTEDGGLTFRRHDFEMERCIDPWVVWVDERRVLLAAIEILSQGSEEERFRLLLFRSDDAGRTWTSPIDLGRAHDHEMLSVRNGVVHLVSRRMRRSPSGEPRHSIYLARSGDGGLAFEDVAETLPSNLALNPTGIAIVDDDLVVSFIDFQRNVDGFDRKGMLDTSRAWLLRFENGSFSEPLFVTEACGMSDGFPGYPFLVADPAGRLHHACIRPGFAGLALTRSPDGGETWSEPATIESPHARTPMLAVNDGGVLGVAWYDRGNDPERRCQDLYFSASIDSGASFLDPIRVSTETSCPSSEGNGVAAERWPSGGDYSSLAATPEGDFRIVWADSRSGIFELRTAVVRAR